MNNENQNIQNELKDEALGSVTGGTNLECYRSMKCMDCNRELFFNRDKIYSYGNAGVVCAKCEEKRDKARSGLL